MNYFICFFNAKTKDIYSNKCYNKAHKKQKRGKHMKIKDKTTILHIAIIVLGIIFISLSTFHSNLWYDESYSVAISNRNFADIWSIGGHDVHPVLYYWILHIIRMIFGNQIMIYRLFSVLTISILGILGFTHIRKDFGKNVGLLFSFFVYFLPINVAYAGEIRMYGLAMLLVTLMAIYAYRIYKNSNEKNIKNWILFGVFSLASAYTHYYALAAAGIINLALLIYFIRKSVKEKKFGNNLKVFIIVGVIQIAAYLPWLMYLLLQISQVSSGFWIVFTFPDTLIEMFTFQFSGNLPDSTYIPNWIAGIFGLIICVYVICLYIKNRKNKEENKPAKYAIIMYGLTLLGVCIMSFIMQRPILYARYMLCITGLFIFFISYIIGKYGNKYITLVVCIISVILATYVNILLIQQNYDSSNVEPIEYLKANVQEGDILIYGNEGCAFVVSANFPEKKQYFWDEANWNIDEAISAYGPNMTIIHNLDEIKEDNARIWVINGSNYAIADSLVEELEAKIVSKEAYSTAYKDYNYTIALVEIDK